MLTTGRGWPEICCIQGRGIEMNLKMDGRLLERKQVHDFLDEASWGSK